MTSTKRYLIMHGGVGAHAQGANVAAAELGGEGAAIERLLLLGAIEETSETPLAAYDPGAMPPANLTTGQPGGAVGTEDEGARLAGVVGLEATAALAANGYRDFAAIRDASDDELRAVTGIGDARIRQLRDLTA